MFLAWLEAHDGVIHHGGFMMTTIEERGRPAWRCLRRIWHAAGIGGAAALLVVLAAVPAAGRPPTSARTGSAVAAHGDHHEENNSDIVFGPAPDVFPPGAEMAVLQGDPSVAGQIFTVRLRFPNGYVLPPHWHPTDEHVTVIKGTFLVGIGDTFDKHALLPPLHRGGFVTAPASVHHFATARGRTIVQVHAIGPFQLNYVNPDDDPRGKH